jgi:hypothetical protein
VRIVILALIGVLALCAFAYAETATLSNVQPIKESAPVTPPPSKGPLQGGDTIATATLISALPYDDTGTTVGYTHDYDEVCAYTGSLSPDVVYKWTPATTQVVDIYTCNSGYDTKLYVYQNSYTPGAPYACNDDSAICSGPSYRSYIDNMTATAGNTYYIVVDGYGSASGAYEFHVHVDVPPLPCYPTVCPAGAIVDAEPICYTDYTDTFNGGCNDVTTPYSFENFALNTTICGTSGVYMFGTTTYREMDWFHYTPANNVLVNLCLCSNFIGRLWIATGDCAAGLTVLQTAQSTAAYQLCLSQALTAGTQYTIIVAPNDWSALACGAQYIVSMYEEGYSPVQNTSWGTIKALYR